jgi:hypothetical protein
MNAPTPSWIRTPRLRYWIAEDHWRSIWIHWGWRKVGILRHTAFGCHLWVSFGPFSIVHSINRGQPGSRTTL